MIKRFSEKSAVCSYFVFRVLVAVLFFLHGAQKVPGILDGSVPVGSLLFFAGLIEVVGSLLLLLGLFVREVAFIAAVEMVVAYFTVHFPKGLSPLANKGELALLFFACFLVLFSFGAGKCALDAVLKR